MHWLFVCLQFLGQNVKLMQNSLLLNHKTSNYCEPLFISMGMQDTSNAVSQYYSGNYSGLAEMWAQAQQQLLDSYSHDTRATTAAPSAQPPNADTAAQNPAPIVAEPLPEENGNQANMQGIEIFRIFLGIINFRIKKNLLSFLS